MVVVLTCLLTSLVACCCCCCCQVLYARLFDALVAKINVSLSEGGTPGVSSIGLLDIYGFESFTINDFEQVRPAPRSHGLLSMVCRHPS